MSVLGLLAKGAKAKPLRSTLDEAVEALARPKGTGAEFLREIEKTKGVKPTEIKERGIDKVLANMPKVNKEEIVKAIQSKANPPIEEKILSVGNHKELDVMEKRHLRDMIEEHKSGELDPQHYNYMVDLLNRGEKSTNHSLAQTVNDVNARMLEAKANGQKRLANELSDEMDVLYDRQQRLEKVLVDNTRYGEYALPNGQNYREILLKLPKGEGNEFTSGHFSEPNILAHMRVSDRTGPNGEKVLHLEELQSDWHQKGREHGYQDPPKQIIKTEANPFAFNRIYDKEVPDAPFKKNWHEVALKKLINYATENGYDRLAITPGAEQAKRYDLSKHIGNLSVTRNPNYFEISAKDPNGNNLFTKLKFDLKNLDQDVGKELAEKIKDDFANKSGHEHNYSGLDLQVGGEGMKGFYDKMLPDYLNKLGKPHGAEVQLHSMPSNPQLAGEFNNMLDHADLTPEMFKALPVEQQQKITSDWTQKTSPSLHTFDLTPSLKNEVTQKGLPLYQQIGIPLGGAEAVNLAQPEPEMKRGGKVSISSNPDTMFMELADRKLAGGGLIKKIAEKLGTKMIPAVEAEANKAKFLEPSQVKEVLYRGQRRAPKPNKFITTQDRATPSFTTDPEVANVYSQQLGWDIAHGPGSTSVPVHVQMEKPFDIRKLGEHSSLDEFIDQMDHDLTVPTHPQKLGYEDLADILYTLDNSVFKGSAKHKINATDSKGYKIRGFDKLADEVMSAGQKKDVDRILYDLLPDASVDAYALADNLDFVKNLKKLGYDSIIHKDVFDAGMPYYKGDPKKIEEGYDAEHVIDAYRPLHQNKIKSAIGNQGTYDTTNPDITKKGGGAVQSLETNLPSLPKTDYHSIDKLMAHLSKEHKIPPQKLHDDFVAKHHMTPDTWIKRK